MTDECQLLEPHAVKNEWSTDEFSSLDFKVSTLSLLHLIILMFNYSKVRLDPKSKITVWMNKANYCMLIKAVLLRALHNATIENF